MFMTEEKVRLIITQMMNFDHSLNINAVNKITSQVNENVEREIMRLLSLHYGKALEGMIKARFDGAAMKFIRDRVDHSYVGVEALVKEHIAKAGRATELRQAEINQGFIDDFIDKVVSSPALVEKIVERINKNQITNI